MLHVSHTGKSRTNRQTDWQTGQTDWQTDGQTDRQMSRQTDWQTNRKTNGQIDMELDRQIERQLHRNTDRYSDTRTYTWSECMSPLWYAMGLIHDKHRYLQGSWIRFDNSNNQYSYLIKTFHQLSSCSHSQYVLDSDKMSWRKIKWH